ncbi:hypothetical protein D3C78_1305300 [compost metagenome]
MCHDQSGDGVQAEVLLLCCFFQEWDKVWVTTIDQNRIVLIPKDDWSNGLLLTVELKFDI